MIDKFNLSTIHDILVDLDDTLIDDTHAMQATTVNLALKYTSPKYESPEQAIARWRELTQMHWQRFRSGDISLQDQRRERIRGFLGYQLDNREADEIFAGYLNDYEQNWRLVSGASEFLKQTASLPRAIVSNGECSQVHRKLSALGIQDQFLAIVTPEDAGVSKPHPKIFLHALALLGLQPSECLMVGDDFAIDIRPAENLGMATFHIVRGVLGREIADAVAKAF